MANTITLFRIAAGIVLLFCPVFSPAFYVFYIAAGLSDMLDGFVARKTDTVSKLGARLDTIADFVLVVVCLIKLLPVLSIPAWLYGWIGIIALIKNVNVLLCCASDDPASADHDRAVVELAAHRQRQSHDRDKPKFRRFLYDADQFLSCRTEEGFLEKEVPAGISRYTEFREAYDLHTPAFRLADEFDDPVRVGPAVRYFDLRRRTGDFDESVFHGTPPEKGKEALRTSTVSMTGPLYSIGFCLSSASRDREGAYDTLFLCRWIGSAYPSLPAAIRVPCFTQIKAKLYT
jgi:hypothetical protein